VVALVVIGGLCNPAAAQVFRPRTGKAAVIAKAAPTAASSTAAPTGAKKTGAGAVAATPTASPAKKTRAGNATKRTKKKGKARGDSDTVIVDETTKRTSRSPTTDLRRRHP